VVKEESLVFTPVELTSLAFPAHYYSGPPEVCSILLRLVKPLVHGLVAGVGMASKRRATIYDVYRHQFQLLMRESSGSMKGMMNCIKCI
jgi:hypothetical protein